MSIDNYAAALLGRVKNTQAIAGREARAFGQGLLAAHQIEGGGAVPKVGSACR